MGQNEKAPEAGQYATLGESIVGHVIDVVFVGPPLVGVLWLLAWTMRLGTNFQTALVMGLATALISNVLTALAERPAVVRAQRSAPGGWDYAIWWFVIPPIVGAFVGLWESPQWVLPTALAALIVSLANAFWMKPWKPGLSRAEVQAAWAATKDLTVEMFGDSKQDPEDRKD